MARVASSTTTSRRGSTRPAILRNPSRLMRAPPAPPQANGGMYLGGRTSSKTFAPVPITVPVPSSVPIAVFAWSPIRLPSSCRPVSRRVPAISRRTRPYVFFKFDVIVPAPRFAQRPIAQWPTKPSCALFAYPRKTQLDSSPRAFVRGPIADARTGPPSTWAFAPTHKGPSSWAPALTSAPLSSTTGPFRTSKTTPGSTAASRSAIAAGSPSTALPGGSGSLSPSKARRSSGSSCSSAGTRSYTPRSTTPGTSMAAACGWGPSHELLQALGAAGGHHERVAVGPHDHHIFQTDHGNVLALGPDHRAAHVVRHRRLSDHHVAVRVRLANAQQGVPGADVVPAKRPGNDREPFGPLQHGHVHRHGPDGGEEARDVARRERGPAGLELARVGARFAQEASHAPGEQPRVPERALAAQQGRAGGGGLLEEAPHGARTAERLRRDDVPVTRLVARRLHAHGDEHVVLGRCTERLAPGRAERTVIAHRPVGVQREHLGSGVALRDPVRGPGDDQCRGRRARLGEDLRPGDLRHHAGHLIDQERSGEDEDPLGRDQSVEPLDRLDQERPVAGERQQLLGTLGRRQRPESGSRPAGQDGGPDAHRESRGTDNGGGGGGGESPSIAAMRAVSLLGLNGLVSNPAPRPSASPRMRSSPSAVRTMTGNARVAAADRSSRRSSRPEPSGKWRSSSMASNGPSPPCNARRASASVRARVTT